VCGNGEVRKALIEHNLRPELVNRFDEVIVFRPLNADDLKRIADRLLGELRVRLEARDITLVWDEVVLDYLSREGFSEQFGARELRRVIEQRVENEIAGMMLRGEIAAGQIVALNTESNELRILVEEDPEDTI
jgi:ATP-dependent Clp protease ATP-binding subunit ClpC